MVSLPAPQIPEDKLRQAIDEVSSALDADIVFYSGYIHGPACWHLETMIGGIKRRRSNVLLFLTTLGGMADEAFRLARCLQNHYPKGQFILLVGTWCKSAGTLLALERFTIGMATA